jgi:crossover junction endodeoxyribonuclease RusA
MPTAFRALAEPCGSGRRVDHDLAQRRKPEPVIAFVAGIPVPKGSTRAFVVKGRAVTTNANAKTKPWQQSVEWVVRDEVGRLTGGRILYPKPDAVSLALRFVLPRRNSEPKRITPPHTRKPDLDKLTRSVMDALTGVAYDDDSQVTELLVQKDTAKVGQQPGVEISLVRRITPNGDT